MAELIKYSEALKGVISSAKGAKILKCVDQPSKEGDVYIFTISVPCDNVDPVRVRAARKTAFGEFSWSPSFDQLPLSGDEPRREPTDTEAAQQARDARGFDEHLGMGPAAEEGDRHEPTAYSVTLTQFTPNEYNVKKAENLIKKSLGVGVAEAREAIATVGPNRSCTILVKGGVEEATALRHKLDSLGCLTELVPWFEEPSAEHEADPALESDLPAATEEASTRPDWQVLDGGDQDELPPAAEG